jgi:LacI family transcriptional regulator
MAVRLKDIARDLGVSVVTVSKVLRGNADISEATRRRVLKRMKELNYQPNMMARGLAIQHGITYLTQFPDTAGIVTSAKTFRPNDNSLRSLPTNHK